MLVAEVEVLGPHKEPLQLLVVQVVVGLVQMFNMLLVHLVLLILVVAEEVAVLILLLAQQVALV